MEVSMKRWFVLGSVVLASVTVLMGADSCGKVVWADTNATKYIVGGAGSTTLHNDTDKAVFLPGCVTFVYEVKNGTDWTVAGPNRWCVWEGNVQRLDAGKSLTSDLFGKAAGTFRARYTVYRGCTDGKPLSQAGCTSEEEVFTPVFEVTP
jgi:hypothetical protein